MAEPGSSAEQSDVCLCVMEKKSLKYTFDFAVILPDNNRAWQVSSRYHGTCTTIDDFPVDCQRIPMYKIHSNGLLGVITAIPGHTHQAVSVLFQILSSAVPRGNTFLFSTAVSCGCVKVENNELISIDTLYGTSSETVELRFYLPVGTEKAYPATAVSKCSGNSRKRSRQCKVQVLVSLDIPVDAVPAYTILMAVNVNKIPCSYKQAGVRKSLFNDEHFEALVDAVTTFIPDIASDPHSVSMPMTPPETCKKQKLIKPSSDKDNLFINLFPCPTTTEERTEQKALIDKFVNDHVIVELDPNLYPHFARCLGLTDVEYTLIKDGYSAQELIYQTIRKWFSKQGYDANVKSFYGALRAHKELQDNFLFYCKEHSKP